MGNVSCTETSKKKEDVTIMESKSTIEQKKIDKTVSSTTESPKKPINKYPPPPSSYDDGHEIYFIPPVVDDDAVGIRDQQGDNFGVASGEAPQEERYSNESPEPARSNEIAYNVDEPGEFPGGNEAMKKFIYDNIVYPQEAIEQNLQGKCYVQFIVNVDGSISNVKIMRGVNDCPECDKEAMRVVKKMPKWNPGKLDGKSVGSYYNLPIIFKMI